MGRTLEDESSLWSNRDIERFAVFNANGKLSSYNTMQVGHRRCDP